MLFNSFLVILSVLIGITSIDADVNADWNAFAKKFGRSYSGPLKKSMRFAVFENNRKFVNKFNAENAQSFKLGLNHLSDLTEEEFKLMKGINIPHNFELNSQRAEKVLEELFADDSDVPDSMDWTKVPDRVSPVKNQSQCASGWAFAATGALEGQLVNQGKRFASLSEQELIECSLTNGKCSGGYFGYAFNDVNLLGGIQDEVSYPYTADDKQLCRFDKKKAVISDDGNIMLPRRDERKLKIVVAKFGPVAVSFNSQLDSFRHYKSGVYYDENCDNSKASLDHAMLLVGYGTDPEGGDYWLVKNSWTEDWGEKGFARVARNRDDHCGISSACAVPLFF